MERWKDGKMERWKDGKMTNDRSQMTNGQKPKANGLWLMEGGKKMTIL
jgi:hypothetical protein